MRVIIKKLKSRVGFSLAETLIAILILLMVSAIVGGAIPAASKVYVDTVDAANAQVLLSTASTVLRDKLSTATSPEAGAGNTVITFKTRTTVGGQSADAWCLIKMQSNTLYMYYGSVEAAHETDTSKYTISSQKLVSLEAKTANLAVVYESVEYDKDTGVVTFKNLRVKKDGTDATLAGPCDLSVRTFS